MPGMAPSKIVPVKMTAEILGAINNYCAERGIDRSALLREAALRAIGRDDLIETMPGRGRPAEKEPPPPPPKKKRRKG